MRWFGESRNFVTKPDKLSSVPRTQRVEEDRQLLQVVL